MSGESVPSKGKMNAKEMQTPRNIKRQNPPAMILPPPKEGGLVSIDEEARSRLAEDDPMGCGLNHAKEIICNERVAAAKKSLEEVNKIGKQCEKVVTRQEKEAKHYRDLRAAGRVMHQLAHFLMERYSQDYTKDVNALSDAPELRNWAANFCGVDITTGAPLNSYNRKYQPLTHVASLRSCIRTPSKISTSNKLASDDGLGSGCKLTPIIDISSESDEEPQRKVPKMNDGKGKIAGLQKKESKDNEESEVETEKEGGDSDSDSDSDVEAEEVSNESSSEQNEEECSDESDSSSEEDEEKV